MESLLSSLTDPSQRLFFSGILIAIILAITLVVIIFLSQIRSLKELLLDAKEIDLEKNREINALQEQLVEIQIKDDALEQELQSFNETKLLLKSKKELIFKMQEKINVLEEKEKSSIEKFEMQMKEFQALTYQYRGIRKRNEILVEENTAFRSENTKILHKVREQERRIYEKLMVLQGNKPQLLKEIKRVAEAVFEKNHHLFDSLHQFPISTQIVPLGEEISKYQQEVLFGYEKSLKQMRTLHDDAIANVALYQKISEDILAIKERLKDEDDLDSLGGEIVAYLSQISGVGIDSEAEDDSLDEEREPKKSLRFTFLLPDNHTIVIDAGYMLKTYEAYRIAIRSKKEAALGEYLQSLQEYIARLSENTQANQYSWMLVPDEEALGCAITHQSRLYDHAYAKQIVLVGPATLFLVLQSIALSWEEKRSYELAQNLASRIEKIYDQFLEYGESISSTVQHLEMLQESFEIQSKEKAAE